jgi:hypothetical protein
LAFGLHCLIDSYTLIDVTDITPNLGGMMNNIDADTLNARMEYLLRRQKNVLRWVMFFVHTGVVLLMTISGWSLAVPYLDVLPQAGSESPILGSLILLTTGGLLSIMFHLISVLASTDRIDQSLRRQLMTQALSDVLLERTTMPEKPKRLQADDTIVELTPEGELRAPDERKS